ncbi:hypothetical protein IZY60_07540 [Lutibacter sp. B2]|nr:hypothetical protein [Lutibacter sp. B2]
MKKSQILIMVFSFMFIMVLFSPISKAGSFEPGSENDPIVTQKYVEKRNTQLKYYIDQKIEEVAKKTGSEQVQVFPKFEIIEVHKGQKIIGEASTEMIIRSGKVEAIASEAGGIADLISGKDLNTGENVPLNHLLLLPRGDGRGINVLVDKTFILIKGSYEIQ